MFTNIVLSRRQLWTVRSCVTLFILSLLFPPTHHTRRGGWAGFQFLLDISHGTDISPGIWVVEWVGLAILLVACLFLGRGGSPSADQTARVRTSFSIFGTKRLPTAGEVAEREVIARTKGPPAVRTCKVCGRNRLTQYVFLRSNVSYVFARRESHLSGFLCFSCLSRSFVVFEVKTALFTWWGLIGLALGPLFLLDNLIQYVHRGFLFLRARLAASQETPSK